MKSLKYHSINNYIRNIIAVNILGKRCKYCFSEFSEDTVLLSIDWLGKKYIHMKPASYFFVRNLGWEIREMCYIAGRNLFVDRETIVVDKTTINTPKGVITVYCTKCRNYREIEVSAEML